MRKLIITGTGRSGTGYMSQLFRTLGFNIGHENVFNPKPFQGWGDFEGDSSWLYPLTYDPQDLIIHIYREPRLSISSRAETSFRHLDQYGEIIAEVIGYRWNTERSESRLKAASEFYVSWFERCQSIAEISWPVERVDAWFLQTVIHRWCRTDVPIERLNEAISKVPTRYNGREYVDYEWPDLPEDVQNIGRRYGYI